MALAALAAGMLALPAGAAPAEGDPPPGVDPLSAITVFPAITERRVRPGQRLVVEITVKNQTERAFSFVGEPTDLARRRGGASALDLRDPGTVSRGAGQWLRPVPGSFTLAARTQREVQVVVEVPDDARPGGAYAALVLRATPVSGDGALLVTPETSVVLLLVVDGPARRSLRVDVDPEDRLRWRGGVARWTVRVRNDGDVHENVSGALRIDRVAGPGRREPLAPGILLPGEARSQVVAVSVRDAPDVFSARASVERDDAPRVAATASRVVVLPWWLLAVLAAGGGATWWRLRRRAVSRAQTEDEGWDGPDGEPSQSVTHDA